MPIAFFAITGVAAADPTDYPVPPVGAEPVVVAPGPGEAAVVAVPANSFFPGETVNYTITGPSIGGGGGQALSFKAETVSGSTTAGADGSVAISFVPEVEGTYTISFSGVTSGRSSSVSVPVGDGVTDPGPGDPGDGDGDGSGDGDTAVVIGVNNGTVIINNGTIIYGTGFVAQEPVVITVVYVNGNVETYNVVADVDGNVNFNTTPSHTGKTVYKLEGQHSGSWASKTVVVASEDEAWNEVTGTTTAAYVQGESGSWASSDGLASTGASVAAPLAIGGTALIAGLGLLFFGTRGAIRRRGGHVSS